MTLTFELDGQEFVALNGGPVFRFSEAISMMVKCQDQQEIDRLWAQLSEGGEEGPCGWLKDRFGLSWQIVSSDWNAMLQDQDPAKRERVMKAILHMFKPDLATIRRAYEGRP